MTNEELCVKIKKGDQDSILCLWDGIKKFVSLKAKERAMNSSTAEYDDLMQEAFLQVEPAVNSYEELEGGKSFLNWYVSYYMPKAFSKAIYSGCTRKEKMDPINSSISLDAPIGENNVNLFELIIDVESELYFRKIEDKPFWVDVMRLIKAGIENISDNETKRICDYMIKKGGTVKDAYNILKPAYNYSIFNYKYNKGLRQIRQYIINESRRTDDVLNEVIQSMERTHVYYGGSIGNYKNHGFTSVVEQIAINNAHKKKCIEDIQMITR